MPATDSALIVGAGPAGLSAAIALRRAGVERVVVLEETDGRGVIGSELALQAPMLRALAALGVADRCAAAGVGIDEAQLCAQDGRVLHRQVITGVQPEELPPMVGITRPRLHEVLTARATEVGAAVRFKLTADELEPVDGGIGVVLSDGSVERFGLVVGADGVGSRLRARVSPAAEQPQYVGQACWRARVSRGDLPPTLAMYYGQTTMAKPGVITVSAEHAYLFCVVTVPAFERIDRDRFPELLRETLAPFGGTIAELRETITNPMHIHYAPLTPVIVSAPWHDGHTVLIGDTVHATTPHLAYGAGLAVEDGVVLGDEIASHDDVEAALAAFTARRFERCRMTVVNGVQLSRWEQQPSVPSADHAALIGASQAELAGAI